ncbi:UNVERIFIED_CONTAM: hypothetical protein Slati_2269500, partial [Sesamum latifolium]
NLLRADSSNSNDVETLAINELFEVASEESESAPLVLFFERQGNAWLEILRRVRHLQLSLKLCGFIPRGLLFAKFGSNLTAFLDLAFWAKDYLWTGKKLDHDTGTVKSQSNIGSICSFDGFMLVLLVIGIGKIIGWVFAITLCIPPKLHPRSRNSSFEVRGEFVLKFLGQ